MRVIWEERGKTFTAPFSPVKKEVIGRIFSGTALRILEVLDKPRTLSEVAKEIGITPQTALYHLRRLKDAGVVVIESGKFYRRTGDAFGVILSRNEVRGTPVPRYLERFFHPFAQDGVWRSHVVVGAPDPHGYYLQRARDGHYATVLGMFLGKHFRTSGFPVKIDTDISYRWKEEDLVLIGGPVANTVSFELIEERNLFFDLDRPWMLKGRRVYTGENVGLIAKVSLDDRWYLLLAGVSALGTKASVMALTSHTDELLTNYKGGEYYWIVEGLDRDGDGTIDTIRLLEHGMPRQHASQPTKKRETE